MPTILILVMAAQLATGASPAEILGAGQPLAAQASYENKSTRPAYLVLALPPGESFTNASEEEFRVLDERNMRLWLDLELSEVAVQRRQQVIQNLREELTGLGGDLETLRGERRPREGE